MYIHDETLLLAHTKIDNHDTYKVHLPSGEVKEMTQDEIRDINQEIHFCDTCGKPMETGFVIGEGWRHYCSEECFTDEYPFEQYLEEYEDEGDSYYTEWCGCGWHLDEETGDIYIEKQL